MQLIQELLLNLFKNEQQNGNKSYDKRIEEYEKLGHATENHTENYEENIFKNAIYAIGHSLQWEAQELGEAFKWTWDKLITALNNYLNMHVQWVCYGEHPCSFCQAMHGKIMQVRNVPPSHPNCRCGLIPIEKRLGGYLHYPGNDPTVPPRENLEWRGQLPIGGSLGAWFDSQTRESWHPDLEHQEPKGPHWDYIDANQNIWSIFPDGRIELNN